MKNKKRLTALAMAAMLAAGTTTGAVLTATAADTSSSSSSETQGSAPTAPPSGTSSDSNGQPPAMPSGDNAQGGPGGGADTQSFDYSGSYSGKVTADGEEVTSESETIDATETDQNALLSENGGTLEVKNGTVTKSGDDTDGDNCNFYGLNSISLTVGEGSKTYLSDTTLSATSEGSNAIFATDPARPTLKMLRLILLPATPAAWTPPTEAPSLRTR